MNTGRTARRAERLAQRPNTRIARLLTPLVTVSLLLLLAGPAYAHADLVSSDPPDGAMLDTSPGSVTLTFSEGLNASRSKFQLLAPDGSLVGTGTAAADGDETMTLAGLALSPGDYLVKWTSVSLDTDILRGELHFSVAQASPAATPGAQPTSAPSPSAPPPASEAPSDPAANASAGPTGVVTTDGQAASTSSSLGDVLLPIVAALVVVAFVGAYLLRRSRSA